MPAKKKQLRRVIAPVRTGSESGFALGDLRCCYERGSIVFGSRIPLQSISLPNNGDDPKLPRDALLFQFILCAIGLIGGFVFLGVGVFLTVKGLTGSITFGFKLPGISADLSNAGPGLVVSVLGLMIAIASLYFYKVSFAGTRDSEESKSQE
jgi:hypothetical protein